MNYWLSHSICRSNLIVSFVLMVFLENASVALAAYRPPSKPSAPKGTGTNTTRGGSCDAQAPIGLTPLVPLSHVGQTTSQHPSFFWFVPDRQAYPVQFRLFKSNGQPLYRTQLQSQPGIMQITLPQNQPELAIEQTYRWQVVLVCNPKTPLTNVVATAEIKVVKPSVSLQTQLTAAPTPQQRVDLYAESGLWYDALAEASKVSPVAQNSTPLLELLDSLAASEAQPLKDWSIA
jgi:hypothetical protein